MAGSQNRDDPGEERLSSTDRAGMTENDLLKLIGEALDKLPVSRFSEVRSLLDTKRQEQIEAARVSLLARFRKEAGEYGLDLEDLFPQTGRRRSRIDAGLNLKPKYRDPETGETWAGRGMKARFLRKAQARGEDIEKYRIRDEGE